MFCCWQEHAGPVSLRLHGGTQPGRCWGSPALPGSAGHRGWSCFSPCKAPREQLWMWPRNTLNSLLGCSTCRKTLRAQPQLG